MRVGSDGRVDINSGLSALALNVVGNIMASGTITQGSARRLKTAIAPLGEREALAALARLEPTRFRYKHDPSDEQLGFIADDVPDIVATHDRAGVSAMDIAALLTKVVQAQQKSIDALRNELDAIHARERRLDCDGPRR